MAYQVAWAELPPELLVHVLRHVPMQQRLQHCASVSVAWARAAAAATDVVQCSLETADSFAALQQFLDTHAMQLQTLKLQLAPNILDDRVLQLPCGLTSLQHLHLPSVKLQLQDSKQVISSRSSSMEESSQPLLPSLLHLNLRHSTVSSPEALLQLATAPQLTSLHLQGIMFEDCRQSTYYWDTAELQRVPGVILDLLQQLSQLVVLDLADVNISDAVVQQLSALTRLQQVSLNLCAGMDPNGAFLQSLPCSLTSLYISDLYENVEAPLGPRLLQHLTALVDLQLSYCQLEPRLLACFTQLQWLGMDGCDLLPDGPVQEDMAVASAGAAELLAALPALTNLRELQLTVPWFWEVTVPLESFSAITASSKLQQLHMLHEFGQPLPPGAVQHMFLRGKRFPQMRVVNISSQEKQGEYCLDAEGLAGLVSCCRGLRRLDIVGVMRSDADISALLQLPACCTQLKAGGPNVTDSAAADVLAQLTQLKQLHLCDLPALTDVGLSHLTTLWRLTLLRMEMCAGLSEDIVSSRNASQYGGSFYLDAASGQGPVYMQLRRLCAKSAIALEQMLHDSTASENNQDVSRRCLVD